MGIDERVNDPSQPDHPVRGTFDTPSTATAYPGGITLEEYLTRAADPAREADPARKVRPLAWFVARHERLVSAAFSYGTSFALALSGMAYKIGGLENLPSFQDHLQMYLAGGLFTLAAGSVIDMRARRRIFAHFSGIKPTKTPDTTHTPSSSPIPYAVGAGLTAGGMALAKWASGVPLDAHHLIGIGIQSVVGGIVTGVGYPTARELFSENMRPLVVDGLRRDILRLFSKNSRKYDAQLEKDRERHKSIDAHIISLQRAVRAGNYRRALELAEETPRMQNQAQDSPVRPGSSSLELHYASFKAVRKQPLSPLGYQTLGLIFHTYHYADQAHASLRAGASRIDPRNPSVAARQHLLQSTFSRLIDNDAGAQEHLREAALLSLRTDSLMRRTTIAGHEVFILPDEEFKQAFIFKPGERLDLAEELRMTREAKRLEQENLKVVTHLGIVPSPLGKDVGVLRYERAQTVRQALERTYDEGLHTRMMEAVGYLAGTFHPGGLAPVDPADYAFEKLRYSKQMRFDDVVQARDALPLLARTLASSPLVTYLDSHPEQFLVLDREDHRHGHDGHDALMRIDIQNQGLRPLAFDLSKAIERAPPSQRASSASGIRDDKHRLVRSAVESYNCASGAHLDVEEQAWAKLGADVLNGLSFAAKEHPHEVQDQVRRSLRAGMNSFEEILWKGTDMFDKSEHRALTQFYRSVYIPLVERNLA